jgi:thiamine biosynthesis lipoprotein
MGQADVRRFERRAMGSPLRLTVVSFDGRPPAADEEADPIDAAWSAVSDMFEAAEQAMSRFRDASDLTTINRVAGTGQALTVDRLLVRALVAAERAGRQTGGRFDARVLGDLERLGYQGAPIHPAIHRGGDGAASGGSANPGLRLLGAADAPATDDGRWLDVDVRSSRVAVETPIDLGGIGKGLALRWASRAIDRAGTLGPGTGILLEAGGDLVGRAPSPEGSDWSIAIEDPDQRDQPKAVIGLRTGAIATSSISIHHWRDAEGRSVHHLIDPATGEPGGHGLVAVTVAGSDPAWAEVWSKTLFLGGVDGIAALARSRGLACWWIRDDGELEMTPAARVRTLWSATDQ